MTFKVMYQHDRAQLFAGGNAGGSMLQCGNVGSVCCRVEMLVIVSGTGKAMGGQVISSIN